MPNREKVVAKRGRKEKMSEISYDAFEAACRGFFARSNELGDEWELVPFQQRTFLRKKVQRKSEKCAGTKIRTEDHKLVTLETHVMFSESFSQPVLYFTAYDTNGQNVLGSEADLDAFLTFRPEGYDPNSTLVSQAPHPYLGQPFWFIHPCHTSETLSLVRKQSSDSNHIATWLSLVGPFVGLSVDPKYFVN